MTQRDLDHLKDLPVPAAREAARRQALDAALAAFDAQARNSDDVTSQGTATAKGPMETSSAKRSFRMVSFSRPQLAIAASIATLVIAAPFAFRHLEEMAPAGRDKEIAITLGAETAGRSDGTSGGNQPQRLEKPAETKQDATARRQTEERRKAEVMRERDASGRTGKTIGEIAAASPPSQPSPPSPPSPMTGFAPAPVMPSVSTLPHSPDNGVMADVAGPMSSGGSAANAPADYYAPESAYLGGNVQTKVFGLDELAPAKPVAEEGRDRFTAVDANPVRQVATDPVSTFSLDVDTASYAFVRRALNSGRLPPEDAVRIEEMINYFPYAYPKPESAEVPFKPTVTVMPSPWNSSNKLVHIAIKGYELQSAERPKANLVFLMDVSGSMAGEDRLPLVKNAFRLLLDQLRPDDTVGIVTYAAGSGVLLNPTKVSEKAKILTAIDQLQAGGSTAGAAGIEDAYRLAEAGFDKTAVNRIVLATDGDFNVGITDPDQLKGYIERKRRSGIFLSILGVGSGNNNDALMQSLAQNGNGTASYVDTLNEARKVLVDEASSTLFTIAKDVKVQIEWNPKRIAEYRLIGYETRGLKREEFNNDGIDAGDIGSGHTVTAIYEVTPVGAPRLADELRYGDAAAEKADKSAPAAADTTTGTAGELGFLKIRYKRPAEDVSQLISLPLTDAMEKAGVQEAGGEQRFSVAVAAFGELLRGDSFVRSFSYDDVLALAQGARGDDPYGYRAEFLNLVRLAKSAR